MKNILNLFMLLLVNQLAHSADLEKINMSDIKFITQTYIFYGSPMITKCDINGTPVDQDIHNAPLFSRFTVIQPLPAGSVIVPAAGEVAAITAGDKTHYIIKFGEWNYESGLFKRNEAQAESNMRKYLEFNKIVSNLDLASVYAAKSLDSREVIADKLDNEAYFIVKAADLEAFVFVYNKFKNVHFNYGTISYFARYRPAVSGSPSRWSTDLSLGLVAGVSIDLWKKASLSFLPGLGITKVNLDSFSTQGFITNTTDRVALTPNFNILFSYDVVSWGLGIGTDIVNEDSEAERHWIYNKKPFISIAFGINIRPNNKINGPEQSSQDN